MSKEKAYCSYCGSKLQHSIFTDANSPKWCANSSCTIKPKKEESYNMASCMLSILDYLKLQDRCKKGAEDMLDLNDETLSEMMFRKMKEYNIDLNEELDFTHLEPVTKPKQRKWIK